MSFHNVRKVVATVVIFFCSSGYVYSDEDFSGVIMVSPMTGLPISVGYSSYDRVFIKSSKYVRAGEAAEYDGYYEAVKKQSKIIVDSTNKHILVVGSDEWVQTKQSMVSARSWWITRLPCPGEGIKCALLGGNGAINLIVLKDGRVTDFQLASAYRYEELSDGRYGLRIASLDTTFGDGVIFQRSPDTNFETTGIFCTEYMAGKYDEVVRHFKRRITPEGKIENKEIQGSYMDCKAPW